MAHGNFKYLIRRTTSDKILRDKVFNIAINSEYDGYERGLPSMVYKSFDKKTASLAHKSASGSGIKHENMSDQQLTEELHKPIIKKFEKRKVHSLFIDNIWGADLADKQLISKFNKEFRFSLCVIDIFSKHAWVLPLKDKKGIRITNIFQNFLKESNRKRNQNMGR